MKFKILNHRYENTGGGCMVGFDTVWLPEEQRTIFVHTNDQGCSFYPVDNYFNDLEEEVEPFTWLDFDAYFPSEHLYGEVAKACLSNFIIDDRGAVVSWAWLPDFVRDQITVHYKDWIMKERNGCFTIDRGKVVIDEAYEETPNRMAQATCHLRYVNLIGSLRNLMDAYLRLCADWSQTSEFDDLLSEEYPFHVSFDELEIPDWVNNSVFKIMENMIEKIEGAKEEM